MDFTLNVEYLMEYSSKHYASMTVGIKHETGEAPYLSINWGKYHENGGVNIIMEFTDIVDILVLNGVDEKAAKENARFWSKVGQDRKELTEHSTLIDDLFYGTLSKYIHQMLHAVSGKRFFPDLKCLDKHKNYFWVDRPTTEV